MGPQKNHCSDDDFEGSQISGSVFQIRIPVLILIVFFLVVKPLRSGDTPQRRSQEVGTWGDDDEDTVFNAISCQHIIEECSNEMCYSLNHDVILECDKKHLKDFNICTNYRSWRSCPGHFHPPSNNCIIKYLFPR